MGGVFATCCPPYDGGVGVDSEAVLSTREEAVLRTREPDCVDGVGAAAPKRFVSYAEVEHDDEPLGAPEPNYLSRVSLGPRIDPYLDDKADWRWEKARGEWRSYPLPESLAIERHWRAYKQLKDSGDDSAYLTKLTLLKNQVEIDFRDLTAKVASGRPRKIRRDERASDWLSNAYFFEAFTGALRAAKVSVDVAPQEMFDFHYVQDFRTVKDDGRKMFRGGKEYELPFGWKRFAVHVKGLYDEGDNQWLKDDESGWAVAYHGTSEEGLPGILATGFRVGDRQKFEATTGKGIYCTPWIGVAQHYSKPKRVKGHFVQIVLQLRVKPSSIKTTPEQFSTDFEKKYWIINDPADIRAYGVLIRELPLRDYVPPEVMVFGKESPYAKKVLEDLQQEIEKAETMASGG